VARFFFVFFHGEGEEKNARRLRKIVTKSKGDLKKEQEI
jgi:hypothetical protein